jgi:hypothetical protein
LSVSGASVSNRRYIDRLNWLPLTYALNALNRSMGADDVYPFTLTGEVVRKLSFVHDRVGNT